jgi:hypothetical protein
MTTRPFDGCAAPIARPGAEAPDRPPLACYANYFEVGHNAFEFLLDAGQVEPQSGEVQRLIRIAISPVHAKLLAQLVAQAIDQFERMHHEIPDLADSGGNADSAFTNPLEFERLAIDARRRRLVVDPDALEEPISTER